MVGFELGILSTFSNFFSSETIEYELARNLPLVDRLLSDVTYQSADNLVNTLLYTYPNLK